MSDKLVNSYNILFNKLQELNKADDNEASHILQDKIYRKFIKDSINNIKSIKTLKRISTDINKYVVKNDKRRWYT